MELLKIIVPFMLISCAPAPGPLGEKTLDISDFDFATPVSVLLPKRYENPKFEDCYNIPSADGGENLMQRDTVANWYTNEPIRIEYRHLGMSSLDRYICFEKYYFNSANFITDFDGRIGVIAGKAGWGTVEESEALIECVTKKYGEPTCAKKEFVGKNYDLFTWTLPDRTIKYAIVKTDESNVMKLEIERDEQGHLTDLREGKRELRTESYIFILGGEWPQKLAESHQSSGDFVYCK